MPVIPTDPLFSEQWHFALVGDIRTVWQDYSGALVHVGVYDNGIEVTHEDLAPNSDDSLQVVDDLGSPAPGLPANGSDSHGTHVAGLIAAAANGVGGLGVAWGAALTAVNIFDGGRYGYINADDQSGFLDVLAQGAAFDILSNSWGSDPGYRIRQNLNLPDQPAAQREAVYALLSQTGRDGLGTVINQAAGNDGREVAGSGLNTSRFTNTIAATERDGFVAAYSNFGSAMLVAAPAASVTTDRSGGAGADPTDYTDSFNGTSAATPVVSGVTALMLQAAPGLGWRDVQDILAASARLTGSALGSAGQGNEVGRWQTNNADTINGGGAHVSASYGYGMVDAYAAVRMAEVRLMFGPARTSANEQVVTSELRDLGGTLLPDFDSTGRSFTLVVTEDLQIDTVILQLGYTSTYPGDLRITLTSPSGTREIIKHESVSINDPVDITWSFAQEHLRGESALGTWVVHVADMGVGDANVLDAAQLVIYGTAPSPDDVHHFTAEFPDLLAQEPARATLMDIGGQDWLDFAAVPGEVALSLDTGVSVEGTVWITIAPGTRIEHAVTGDGDDWLLGNAAANELDGMRGNDSLSGLAGQDTLRGGFGPGDDVLLGGPQDDSLNGGLGHDVLNGGGGADVLIGGGGFDLLVGGTGDDTLAGGSRADVFVFAAGWGADEIADWTPGEDSLRIVAGAGDGLTLSQQGEDLLLVLDSTGDSILLRDTSMFQLDLSTDVLMV